MSLFCKKGGKQLNGLISWFKSTITITESIKHALLSHIYLVELSNERLSGPNGSGAIHFEIGEAILPHEHLQDLQHLCVCGRKGFRQSIKNRISANRIK